MGRRLDGQRHLQRSAYQRQVKRVISWILQQGMDVILDLHYVAGARPQIVGHP